MSRATGLFVLMCLPILSSGCANDQGEPWRAALDEGKVIRLGGAVGKLSPQPPLAAPLPQRPAVVQSEVVQPAPATPTFEDPFTIPPPPKALQSLPKPKIPADEPELGPPK